MIISIDKYKKTGGGSSSGSNTGGNTGSNASTYNIPADIKQIQNIMFERKNYGDFSEEVKSDLIQNGIAKFLDATLLLSERHPKLVYTANGWEEVIDNNGNVLQTCVLPDDFFDYQQMKGNNYSKEDVINDCLNNYTTNPTDDLIDQVFCNYDTENGYDYVCPYIKTITYATNNDQVYCKSNIGYRFNTYYGPDNRYSISLDTIYCVPKFDINNVLQRRTGSMTSGNKNMQGYFFLLNNNTPEEKDVDCYMIGLNSGDETLYIDGKYICGTSTISKRGSRYQTSIKDVKKCAVFYDVQQDKIVNPTFKFIDGWYNDDCMGNLPYAYYNIEIEGGHSDYGFGNSDYSYPVFGTGLKNFTINFNNNNVKSFYSFEAFNYATDLETITINFDESIPEFLSSDFYFGDFLTHTSATTITFNTPHKLKFNNTGYTSSIKFSGCKNVKEIKGLDLFYNFNKCSSMFSGCSSLTSIPEIDTTNATNMDYMFRNCKSLTSIPEIDTTNVTDMYSSFSGCSSLTSIPAINTTNVTRMEHLFDACSSLTSIPEIDTTNVTAIDCMIRYCSSLTDLGGFKNLSVSCSYTFLDQCPNLTVESLMNVINKLATVSGKSLKFGQTNLDKLTPEQIAVATSKGWTLTA